MTTPPPEFGINAEGPIGESLFHGFYPWGMKDSGKELQPKLEAELRQLQTKHADRLLVLLSALVVENALDDLLASLMKGYNDLKKHEGFTFSLKISVAKALRIIPSRLLGLADTIRSMRNAFAHNLHIEHLTDLDPKLLASLKGHVTDINRDNVRMESVYDEVFHGVTALTIALHVYRRHVTRANEYIRSPEFINELASRAEKPAV